MSRDEVRTLRPNPVKVATAPLLFLAISVYFVVSAVQTIANGNGLGWWLSVTVAVVLGLGDLFCVLILLMLILRPHRLGLEIGPAGITVRSLFQSKSFSWSDVHTFSTAWVVGTLPQTYGMSARELADLLNEYKTRYASAQPTR